NSDAHGDGAAECFLHSFDAVGDSAHGPIIIESRRGDAMPVQFGAVALEGDKFDFCAAEIDANAKGMVFRRSHYAPPLQTRSILLREGTCFRFIFESAGLLVGRRPWMTKIPNFTPFEGAILGWEVDDIQATAKWLRERGVNLENYPFAQDRSEEHTSELQSLAYLVCRLLLEKKKKKKKKKPNNNTLKSY